MRLFLWAEYYLNILDGNPNAKTIYQNGLFKIDRSDFVASEEEMRKVLERVYLQKLDHIAHQIYCAFYESTRLELERIKISAGETPARKIIISEELAAFKNIVDSKNSNAQDIAAYEIRFNAAVKALIEIRRKNKSRKEGWVVTEELKSTSSSFTLT